MGLWRFGQVFPVFSGRHPDYPLEHADEALHVEIPDLFPDLADLIGGRGEQLLGLVDPHLREQVVKRLLRGGFEYVVEMRVRIKKGVGQVRSG